MFASHSQPVYPDIHMILAGIIYQVNSKHSLLSLIFLNKIGITTITFTTIITLLLDGIFDSTPYLFPLLNQLIIKYKHLCL